MKILVAATALLATLTHSPSAFLHEAKPPSPTTFALFFYETPSGFQQRSGKGADAYWTKWGAYIQKLRDDDQLQSGSALLPSEGLAVIDKSGWKPVSGSLQLSGYAVISAEDVKAAREIAAQSPAIADGGKVEVRQLMVMASEAK